MTEREYNECVNQYADNLYRFIVKNLQHEEDARDIVQTAFEKLWVTRHQVITNKSKSYLFTIAYNQMIDHIRKVKRISHKESFNEQSLGTSSQQHIKDALQHALNKLTELQRSLVMLKDYEGYSYQEIGVIANLSDSQVKVYLHRARMIMKNFLISIHTVI